MPVGALIMDVRLRNVFHPKQDITESDYCDNFLTNDVENINSQIKKWNCRKKSGIGCIYRGHERTGKSTRIPVCGCNIWNRGCYVQP